MWIIIALTVLSLARVSHPDHTVSADRPEAIVTADYTIETTTETITLPEGWTEE